MAKFEDDVKIISSNQNTEVLVDLADERIRRTEEYIKSQTNPEEECQGAIENLKEATICLQAVRKLLMGNNNSGGYRTTTAEKVVALIRASGLNQPKLAELSGVSQSAISKLLSGTTSKRATLDKLSSALLEHTDIPDNTD